MVGNAVTSTKGPQFADNGLPEITLGSGCCNTLNRIRHMSSIFLYLLFIFLYLLFIFFYLLLFLLHNRTLALLFQVAGRWRQTTLIIAGTILQIAVNIVFGLGEFHLLHKRHAALEEAQLHIKQLVELFQFLAARLQLADRFHTLHLHGVEGGRDGTVVAEIGGIHMPSRIDGGTKHNLCLATLQFLQLRTEVYGVHHLSHGSHGHQDHHRRHCHPFHYFIF